MLTCQATADGRAIAVASPTWAFPVSRMQGFGTTIFAEMSALAAETGAVNLGQGFPDTDGPRVMLEAAKAAIDGGRNQYPPGRVSELLEAVAAHQWRFYGLELDPVASGPGDGGGH